jgi:TP901 family phage tail tape measure protein
MADAAALVQVTLRGKDELSKVFKGAESSADTFGQKLGGIGSAAAGLATGAAVAGIAAVSAGLVGSVKAAAGFEQTMANVASTLGTAAWAEEGKAIQATAMQLGRDYPLSAAEAGKAMEMLAQKGISASNIIGGGAKSVVELATATGSDLVTAAEIGAAVMDTFSINADDMGRVTDVMTAAILRGGMSATDYGFAMKSAGAVVNLVGGSVEDASAAFVAMAKAGIDGSDAGTSLKTMYLNLLPSTDKAAEKMKELGLITADGANQFFDAEGNAKSYTEISGLLAGALQGMGKDQQEAALKTIFGADAIRAAAVAADVGRGKYGDLNEIIGESGIASAASAAKMNSLQGSWSQLTGSVETAAVTIGLALTPVLKGLADQATGLVNNLLPVFEKIATAVAELFTTGDFDTFATQMGAMFQIDVSGFLSALEGVRKAWEDLQPTLQEFGKTIQSEVLPQIAKLADFLGERLGQVLGEVAKLWEQHGGAIVASVQTIVAKIRQFWTDHGQTILDILTTAWNLLQATFTVLLQNFSGLFTAALQILAGDWAGAWTTIQGVLTNAWTVINTVILPTALLLFQQLLTVAWQAVLFSLQSAWTLITQALQLAWTNIGLFLTTWLNAADTGLVSLINLAWLAIQTAIPTAWALITTTLITAWTAITTALMGWLGLGGSEGEEGEATGLVGLVGSAWTAIQTAAAPAWAAILGVLQGAWATVTAGATALLFGGGEGDGGGGLVGMFANAWSQIQQGVENVLQAAMNAASEAFKTPIAAAQALIDKVKEVIDAIGNLIEAAKKLPGSIGLPSIGGGGFGLPLPGMTAPGAIIGAGSGSWGALVPGGSGSTTSAGTHGGSPAVDIFAPTGTPILSPVGGTIIDNGFYSLGGYTATMRGDDGRYYYFAHALGPMAGGRVSAGQQIGQVDSTGNARGTSPHLHFAVASSPGVFSARNGSGDISPDVVRRAMGGWIDEPVLGIGLHSGRRWSFGEREAEYVTPRSRMGGGDRGELRELARELAGILGQAQPQIHLHDTGEKLIAKVEQRLGYLAQRRQMGW